MKTNLKPVNKAENTRKTALPFDRIYVRTRIISFNFLSK